MPAIDAEDAGVCANAAGIETAIETANAAAPARKVFGNVIESPGMSTFGRASLKLAIAVR
jgi:hypothetical protein